jgi:hypothetical protein
VPDHTVVRVQYLQLDWQLPSTWHQRVRSNPSWTRRPQHSHDQWSLRKRSGFATVKTMPYALLSLSGLSWCVFYLLPSRESFCGMYSRCNFSTRTFLTTAYQAPQESFFEVAWPIASYDYLHILRGPAPLVFASCSSNELHK